MSLTCFENIQRDPTLQPVFQRFAARSGLVPLIDFVAAPDDSGDYVARYFSDPPDIDLKLSPDLSAAARDAVAEARRNSRDRQHRLKAEIAEQRALLCDDLERLADLNRKGGGEAEVASLRDRVRALSDRIKTQLSVDLDAAIAKEADILNRSDIRQFLNDAVDEAAGRIEAAARDDFPGSYEYRAASAMGTTDIPKGPEANDPS